MRQSAKRKAERNKAISEFDAYMSELTVPEPLEMDFNPPVDDLPVGDVLEVTPLPEPEQIPLPEIDYFADGVSDLLEGV